MKIYELLTLCKSIKLDPLKYSFIVVPDEDAKKSESKFLKSRDSVSSNANNNILKLQLFPPLSRRKFT
jgi:hypothetical protein